MTEVTNFAHYVGQQAEPDRISRFVVNEAMIQQWIEALGDNNPVYTDESQAFAHGRSSITCPPAMISTWVMQGYARQQAVREQRSTGTAEATPYSRLMHDLDLAGYTSVVATNIEQVFERDIPVGTRVRCEYTIHEVSEVKQTALGEGRFVTLHKTYRDESESVLAQEWFRMLRFAPVPKAAPPRPTGVPRIVRTLDNAFWFDGAAEGKLLIQRCTDCQTLRHPPGPACPKCRSFAWDSVESSRRGTLHSWTVVHHPHDAAFSYPLAVGLIDLDEGIRFVADFESVPSHLEIGMPVHLGFSVHAHGETLPVMRVGEPTKTATEISEVLADSTSEDAISLRLSADVVEIPPLSLMLDHTTIVAGALASQDYEDVHHSTTAAKARGLTDIIVSINTTNGLVGRYITDWAGPGVRITEVKMKLGVPHVADQLLTFTGTATPTTDGWSLQVSGTNDTGVHVVATATVRSVTTEKES